MDIMEWIIIWFMFIVLFFKEYLFSYFKKKWENLATQEDIENITKKIEETKSDINMIYKNIEFVNDKENNILLNIFDDLTILFNELLIVNFWDIYWPKENYIDEMKKYEKDFYKNITAITINYHHALVYIKDKELLSNLSDIYDILLKIRVTFKNNFSWVKISWYNEVSELSNVSFDKKEYWEKVKKADESVKKYYYKINPLKKELFEKYNLYIFNLKTFFDNKNIIINEK